ncbi:MAG: TIGR00341 family protein [Candidatus Magasanikbacteria bacterium CG_4_10_14_0_2_um_filter_37_12]|uniref:TIGR00341 family protein n=1 Tax=Candidatus Magasanikbacteria bacterium CG_4_10_14_0_2_um_filter_37_12 TaxID=1974637 RepID=A0A2M7V9M6_9BACT|nr:MAG: TIGR00341 family protein [Candidatus Magasanikbacteria bacterium CG_4_10_14_0_2_um_filter_37_12]
MSVFSPHIIRIRTATEKRLEVVTIRKGDFYFLIAISSAMAVFGLVLNNVTVVIGAMVVAPLVTPLFAFSLSLLILHFKRLSKSFIAIVLGTLVSLFVSYSVSLLVIMIEGKKIVLNTEILSRAEPNLLYFFVALLAGMAGAFAYAKPRIIESVIGIAIAVAIIPPIAVSGIGLAIGDLLLAKQSFFLYVFNILGICLGSLLMFLSIGFGKQIDPDI